MIEPPTHVGVRADPLERQRWQQAATATASDSLSQWIVQTLNRASKRDIREASRRQRQAGAEPRKPFPRKARA